MAEVLTLADSLTEALKKIFGEPQPDDDTDTPQRSPEEIAAEEAERKRRSEEWDAEYQRRLQLEREEDERKERERFERYCKAHGIPPRYQDATWNNWQCDTEAKRVALEQAKTAWDKNLFFCGNNGTGKTHLAMCLAHDGAYCHRLSDIFREVREAFNNKDSDSESELLDWYGGRKLLIIDEVGRQKCSEFEYNFFLELIDRRYNNLLPTTLITNLSVKEFADIYGMAAVDRLRPKIVRFDWESYRKQDA